LGTLLAVFAYYVEPESAPLSHRRAFVSVDGDDGGFRDGMTVDTDGFR
jgi:hypothetical protein